MARLEPVDPAALQGAAAELYARYARGERVGPDAAFTLLTPEGQLTGPPAAWLLNPELGLGLERLGHGTRFSLSLPARIREIVILLVAEHEDSPFERYAHHPAARRAGLSEEEIAAIGTAAFTPADAREAIMVRVASALLTDGALGDDLWRAAAEAWGPEAIFEVVTLVGWYRMMALQLRVFEIAPPA